MKFYVDTSIWRDYYEDRVDNLRPLGEFAFNFFKFCKLNDYKIIISKFVVDELKSCYPEQIIKEIFGMMENYCLLETVETSIEYLDKARKLKSNYREVSFLDIVHAIIARENGAVLVTRDKHFILLKDIVISKKPEEITSTWR